jgi:L-ascorbate metabolism protein UlaG (beta-lactamase superfamily)
MLGAPMVFSNLDGSINRKTFLDVVRWKLDLGEEKRVARDPSRDRPAPRIDNDGAALQGAERSALTWIGHATFLIQLGGKSILVDPIFSERLVALPRLVAPGVAFARLPKIDAVLVTHNHRDHMDAPTLSRIGARALYIVPKGLAAWFRREDLDDVVELGWWEHHDLGGVRITFVPSQHWSQRTAFDRNTTLWGGYVLEDGTHRVYHSGDTAYFEGFSQIAARVGRIDAAMLPIGAYEPRWFMKTQHMNPDDAVSAFIDLKANRFVAMHWGTFRLTDENLSDPPEHTRTAWHGRRLEDDRLLVPEIGRTLFL